MNMSLFEPQAKNYSFQLLNLCLINAHARAQIYRIRNIWNMQRKRINNYFVAFRFDVCCNCFVSLFWVITKWREKNLTSCWWIATPSWIYVALWQFSFLSQIITTHTQIFCWRMNFFSAMLLLFAFISK